MRLLAHRAKRVAQALGQELRLGDRGKVPAEVVFSPRGDVVVALRELTRWLGKRDSFAAEDADRCRNRRHICSRERRAGEVAMSPVRQQGLAIVSVVQYSVRVESSSSRSNAGLPSGRVLLHATIFSPIHAASPAGLSDRPAASVLGLVACSCM